jgi:signal-transduction protein with cAMP-binding, CBS, and nucleotidyltransferase domain
VLLGARISWAGITLPSRAAAKRKRRPPLGRRQHIQLLSQAKTIDQIVITIDVATLQILEKAAALADQLQQTAARMIVLLVSLEMILQLINALVSNAT